MIRAVLRSTISISVIFFVYVSIEVYATQKKKQKPAIMCTAGNTSSDLKRLT